MARTEHITADSNTLEVGSCNITRIGFNEWSDGSITLNNTNGFIEFSISDNYATNFLFEYENATNIEVCFDNHGFFNINNIVTGEDSGVIIIDFTVPYNNSILSISIEGTANITKISNMYTNVEFCNSIGGIYFKDATDLSSVLFYVPDNKVCENVYFKTPSEYEEIFNITHSTYSTNNNSLMIDSNNPDFYCSNETLNIACGGTANEHLVAFGSIGGFVA